MRRFPLPSCLLTVLLCAVLSGCASAPERFTKSHAPGKFTVCSIAPHCVSSQANKDSSRYVAPFGYTGSAEHARDTLLQTLRESKDAKVQLANARFVHATFHSAVFHFVDDVTFIIQSQNHVIDVKSSARLGFYDFGVNRRRVERLRSRFEALLGNS